MNLQDNYYMPMSRESKYNNNNNIESTTNDMNSMQSLGVESIMESSIRHRKNPNKYN